MRHYQPTSSSLIHDAGAAGKLLFMDSLLDRFGFGLASLIAGTFGAGTGIFSDIGSFEIGVGGTLITLSPPDAAGGMGSFFSFSRG